MVSEHIDTMKLALEALEYIDLTDNDRDFLHPHECYMIDEAITALREALAEHPAQGCEYCNHPLYAGTKCKNCGRVTEQAAIKRDLTPEQPAQQEPLTRDQVKAMMVENGYYKASPQECADFINGLRHGEVAHGITKGGAA